MISILGNKDATKSKLVIQPSNTLSTMKAVTKPISKRDELVQTAYTKAQLNMDKYNSSSPTKLFKRNHKTISYSLSTGKSSNLGQIINVYEQTLRLQNQQQGSTSSGYGSLGSQVQRAPVGKTKESSGVVEGNKQEKENENDRSSSEHALTGSDQDFV